MSSWKYLHVYDGEDAVVDMVVVDFTSGLLEADVVDVGDDGFVDDGCISRECEHTRQFAGFLCLAFF